MKGEDVYKDLRLRGYEYGPTFQGILSSNNEGNSGVLKWNDNWVSFLDTMLQMSILPQPGKALRLPTRIKRVRIDPIEHQSHVILEDLEAPGVQVVVDKITDTCVAGGVEMLSLHATVAPRRQNAQKPPVLEDYFFVPYHEHNMIATENETLVSYWETVEAYCSQSLRQLINVYANYKNSLPNKQFLESLAADLPKTKVSDLEIQAYSDVQTYPLLNHLKNIFTLCINGHADETMPQKLAALIADCRVAILKDPLAAFLSIPRAIDPIIDTCMENIGGFKIKLLEIGGQDQWYHPILKHLNLQPQCNPEYLITNDHEEPIIAAGMELKNVGPWSNLLETAPAHLEGIAHAVILSDSLSALSQDDIIRTLQNVALTVKEKGFLIVKETTKKSAYALALQVLSEGQLSPDADESRQFGLFFPDEKWAELFQKAGWQLISSKSDGLVNSLFLARKIPASAVGPHEFFNIDDAAFGWVESLKLKLQEYQGRPANDTLWLRSTLHKDSGVVGMVNCLRQEEGGSHLRCLFNAVLEEKTSPELSPTSPEIQSLVEKDLLFNVVREVDGKFQYGAFHHVPIENSSNKVPAQHAYINVLTRGDLSSLSWIESPLRFWNPRNAASTSVMCNVHFASLNFRDIMLATGKLPPDAIPGDMALQDCILGMEFSGINTKTNQCVMGLLAAKGLATTVDADTSFCWPVPPNWSMSDAATVPVVYATAYYAIIVRGQLKPGERILIHSGSGGVGQAAISIALSMNCEVFTTVGSKAKKEYLMSRFPQLKDRNFANSRDNSFEFHVLKETNGRGVNVVLNSLAEEKLHASVRCLSQHGRFLEIGKFDLSNNSGLGMAVFLKNVAFHGILLDALFEPGNPDWPIVHQLVTSGIKSGAVRPLNGTIFSRNQVEEAFRYMAAGKHIGKVLLQIRDEAAHSLALPAIRRFACNPDKSYLLIGGLGGFGLELAGWLAERGAKHLVITSRGGVRTGFQARHVRQLRQRGVNVEVSKRDVTLPSEAEALIRDTQKRMAPVGGLFILAAVLKDNLMENQTQEAFQAVAAPKHAGKFNFFVFFD